MPVVQESVLESEAQQAVRGEIIVDCYGIIDYRTKLRLVA